MLVPDLWVKKKLGAQKSSLRTRPSEKFSEGLVPSLRSHRLRKPIKQGVVWSMSAVQAD